MVSCVGGRRRRRWSFAGCQFDEANWTLSVEGRRVAIEAKPLELLRELLLNAGNLVTKDELLDRVWPDVAVVEASLPTAGGKLRRALRDDRRDRPIIETVPRIGYRLAMPVSVEDMNDIPSALPAIPQSADTVRIRDDGGAIDLLQARKSPSRRPQLVTFAAIVAFAFVALALALPPARQAATKPHSASFSNRDVSTALRKVDIDKVEQMLAAGWDPDTPLDIDRNNALNVLLNNCEWDPGHDQRKMLLMARTLIDGGASFTSRNAWGDTAYSIASAKRYCGPDHPVTKMIKRMCEAAADRIGDHCLADYHRDSTGAVVRQDAPPLAAGHG